MGQASNKPREVVHVEDGLLFILAEITNKSLTQIMAYFLERAYDVAKCQTNVYKLSYGGDPDDPKSYRAPVQQYGDKLIVLRGYFPDTPIAYKLCFFGTEKEWDVWVKAVKGTKHRVTADAQSIKDALAHETLLGDSNSIKPVFRRPRAMTPTGAKPQHYRKPRKKKK